MHKYQEAMNELARAEHAYQEAKAALPSMQDGSLKASVTDGGTIALRFNNDPGPDPLILMSFESARKLRDWLVALELE